MKFYEFGQNNSGGSFDHEPDTGIGYKVYIEAESATAACDKAELIGIYFNGCEDGRDCDCCGDRWSTPWNDDGEDAPTFYGEALRPVEDGEEPMLDCGIPTYIHYADGTFKAAQKVEP